MKFFVWMFAIILAICGSFALLDRYSIQPFERCIATAKVEVFIDGKQIPAKRALTVSYDPVKQRLEIATCRG